jgi:hypothetical protein
MYEVALAGGADADRLTLLRHLATCLDAAARYRKAAERWRELGALVEPDERAEIMVHEASSLLGAADIVAGYARLDEAMRAIGAPPLEARGAGRLLAVARFLIGPRRARLALPSGELDPIARGRIERDIHLAALAGYFDPLGGLRFLLRAADACRRSGAIEDLASCHYLMAFSATFASPRRGRVRLAERYRAAADAAVAGLATRRAQTRSYPISLDACDLLRAGQFEGAARGLDESLAILEGGGIYGSLEHLYLLILRCAVETARQRIGPLQIQHRRLVAAYTEVGGSTVAAQVALFGAARAFLLGRRDEARRILTDFAADWPAEPLTAQRVLIGLIQGMTDIDAHEPAEVRRRLRAVVETDRRFRLLSSMDCASYWSIVGLVEARAILAGDRAASRRVVERAAARALAAPPLGAGRALRARAYVARTPEKQVALLLEAERESLRWDQRVDVAIARHQRGKRLGGVEGARLRGEAREILHEVGVPNHWLDEDVV